MKEYPLSLQAMWLSTANGTSWRRKGGVTPLLTPTRENHILPVYNKIHSSKWLHSNKAWLLSNNFRKFTSYPILSVSLLAQGFVFCCSWFSYHSLGLWKTKKIKPKLNNGFSMGPSRSLHPIALRSVPLLPEEEENRQNQVMGTSEGEPEGTRLDDYFMNTHNMQFLHHPEVMPCYYLSHPTF